MKGIGRSSLFVSFIVYSLFSIISLKQCIIAGAEEKILKITALMYMPFTLGTLFTFDIFLNLFLNQNKARDREVYEGFYNDKEVIAEDKQYLEDRISKSKNNMV